MEQPYQDPYQDQYSLYGSSPYASSSSVQPIVNTDLLMSIFTNTDIIERIEHSLRGERQIQDKDDRGNLLTTKKWVRIPGAKALMNEEGIAKVLQVLDSCTNQKIYGYTYYEKEEIVNIMMTFTTELIQHLAKKWRDYGIDIDDIGLIVEMITNPFWATLQKSFRGFIPENTQSMIYRTEGGRPMSMNQGVGERKGVLAKIFPNM